MDKEIAGFTFAKSMGMAWVDAYGAIANLMLDGAKVENV
jgi:hypothetical protein